MNILIADAMSDEAVDILRSATIVTRDIIEKADNLKVIGRAGIGVDVAQ